MIAVQLEGRLGNQLFQYAFIYAAAKRLNTTFYIDKGVEDFILPKYFEVESDFPAALDRNLFSIDGYKNIFRVHGRKAFYKLLNTLIFRGKKIVIDNEIAPADALKLVKNNYLYHGFFHSQNYFHDFKNEVREQFTIKKPFADAFSAIKQQFPDAKKKAIIHIRRTDYVAINISLPVSYYKDAITKIAAPDVEYIFISDDPAFIESEFAFIPHKYVSTQSEIIDFQFLMDADICILSCSSFSWWGAWLNQNPNKQVYAPRYWLGFKEGKEFPAGAMDHLNINWIET
jgi:hypothetical protein